MKKIFINITYIVLSVMSLTYLLVGCAYVEGFESPQGIIAATAHTGLPIIGLILIFPIIILTIVAVSTNKPKVIFARDVIAFFASIFILASTIITFCICPMANFYVPIIQIICVVILLVTSSMAIINAIKQDELSNKKVETSETETTEEKSE